MQSFARKVLISKKPRENETKTNKTKNLRFGRTWDESWGPGRFPEKNIYIYLCVSVVFHCFLDLDFLCYPIYIYIWTRAAIIVMNTVLVRERERDDDVMATIEKRLQQIRRNSSTCQLKPEAYEAVFGFEISKATT